MATFVESKNTTGDNVTSLDITFDSTPSDGNLIVLVGITRQTTGPHSITSSGFVEQQTLTAAQVDIGILSRIAASEADAVYTISWTNAAAFGCSVYGFVFSGVSSATQETGNGTSSSGGGSTAPCGSITPTDGAVLVAIGGEQGASIGAWSIDNSYTLQGSEGEVDALGHAAAYRIIATGAAHNPTFDYTSPGFRARGGAVSAFTAAVAGNPWHYYHQQRAVA